MNYAKEIARKVARNDTVLAHINPEEARMLARTRGMSINPDTGLPQFGLFGFVGDALGGVVGLPLAGSLLSGGKGGVAGVVNKATGGGVSGLFGGGNTQADRYLQGISTLTQPLTSAGQQKLQQFQSGNLTTADQESLARATDAQKAAARSYYSKAGLGDSAALTNALSAADQNETILRQQLQNNYLTQAVQLYNAGLGPFESAATAALNANLGSQQAGIGALGDILGGFAGNIGLGSLFGSGAAAAGTGAAVTSGIGLGAGGLLGTGGIGGALLLA